LRAPVCSHLIVTLPAPMLRRDWLALFVQDLPYEEVFAGRRAADAQAAA
jgi:hypothetical protein